MPAALLYLPLMAGALGEQRAPKKLTIVDRLRSGTLAKLDVSVDGDKARAADLRPVCIARAHVDTHIRRNVSAFASAQVSESACA